jgi:hypothetical protein
MDGENPAKMEKNLVLLYSLFRPLMLSHPPALVKAAALVSNAAAKSGLAGRPPSP